MPVSTDSAVSAPRRRGRPPGSKNRPKSNSGLPDVSNVKMISSFISVLMQAASTTELIDAIEWFSIVLHQKYDVLAKSENVPLLQRAVATMTLPYHDQLQSAIAEIVANQTPETKMVIELLAAQFPKETVVETTEETEEMVETEETTEEMVVDPNEMIPAAA